MARHVHAAGEGGTARRGDCRLVQGYSAMDFVVLNIRSVPLHAREKSEDPERAARAGEHWITRRISQQRQRPFGHGGREGRLVEQPIAKWNRRVTERCHAHPSRVRIERRASPFFFSVSRI